MDESKNLVVSEKNSKSMLDPNTGYFFLDQIATFIKNKFVSGPFFEPPLENLLVNNVFCVIQPDKYRPIVHVSKPKDFSVNNAVKPLHPKKITMTSQKQLAQIILQKGKTATMSKIDHRSAYKLILVCYDQLKYQGFMYGNAYFVETSRIFGHKISPPNYDSINGLNILT